MNPLNLSAFSVYVMWKISPRQWQIRQPEKFVMQKSRIKRGCNKFLLSQKIVATIFSLHCNFALTASSSRAYILFNPHVNQPARKVREKFSSQGAMQTLKIFPSPKVGMREYNICGMEYLSHPFFDPGPAAHRAHGIRGFSRARTSRLSRRLFGAVLARFFLHCGPSNFRRHLCSLREAPCSQQPVSSGKGRDRQLSFRSTFGKLPVPLCGKTGTVAVSQRLIASSTICSDTLLTGTTCGSTVAFP